MLVDEPRDREHRRHRRAAEQQLAQRDRPQNRQHEQIAEDDRQNRQRSRMDGVEKAGDQAEEQRVASRSRRQIPAEQRCRGGVERNEGVLRPGEVRVQEKRGIEAAGEGDPARRRRRHADERRQDPAQGKEQRADQQRVDRQRRLIDRAGIGEQPEGGQQKQRVAEMVELTALHIRQIGHPGEVAGVAEIANLVGQDERLLHLQAGNQMDRHQGQIGQQQTRRRAARCRDRWFILHAGGGFQSSRRLPTAPHRRNPPVVIPTDPPGYNPPPEEIE